MKNETFLDFCIWNFDDITHEEITHRLGIQPVRIYVKGQAVNSKFPARKAKNNGWRMRPSLDTHSSFEDQMNKMLDIIEQKIDLFRPLCEKYYCEFSYALYIRYDNGESTPWIHLNERYNELVRKLKIEFDVDIYCLPNAKS